MAFSQANRVKVGKAVHNREEFTHASMSGRWVSSEYGLSNVGQLNYHPETLKIINDLLKDRDVYVVYSYATPIAYAWDKEIHVPNHHYSVTTSHHQSIARLAEHYATAY